MLPLPERAVFVSDAVPEVFLHLHKLFTMIFHENVSDFLCFCVKYGILIQYYDS